MPIEYRRGDMFKSGANILVNPVNCKGVSGAGVAKEFAKRFPYATRKYKQDTWMPGFIRFYADVPEPYDTGSIYDYFISEHQAICYFATKYHWRNPSHLDFINEGLHRMSIMLFAFPDWVTIAMPAVGCGLGGLKWEDVKPLIEDEFRNVNQTVFVYEPK